MRRVYRNYVPLSHLTPILYDRIALPPPNLGCFCLVFSISFPGRDKEIDNFEVSAGTSRKTLKFLFPRFLYSPYFRFPKRQMKNVLLRVIYFRLHKSRMTKAKRNLSWSPDVTLVSFASCQLRRSIWMPRSISLDWTFFDRERGERGIVVLKENRFHVGSCFYSCGLKRLQAGELLNYLNRYRAMILRA